MRYKTVFAAMLFSCLIHLGVQATDFANLAQRPAWLAHPVYGEASFDAFERLPGNPIVRGKAPHEWPVNGFLFEDPQSGHWFAYTGHYARNYGSEAPSFCTVSRSKDQGRTWEHLGPVFPDTPHSFDGETSPEGNAPDVSVVFADGRYHMVYDWSTESTTWENIFNPGPDSNNGAAYAWAERPEGPFHRSARPICTTREQSTLLGKYRRQYASTLIRRANDWLVLTLTDSGPNYGWAYVGRTAPSPEGPWSAATLLLHPEGDTYHPPLLEFHPAFANEGWVYAPATSVALNRNVQAIFRAPMERAMDPAAWELHQMGSVWHAEPVENEHHGIWGQTITGFIGADGYFNVLFPSRDPDGFGSINLARRPWNSPWRDQGFVVSAHRGPSLALLKWAGTPQAMEVSLTARGTVRLLWGATMPLGPDEPRSDASLHALMKTRYHALELTDGHWHITQANDRGEIAALAEGTRSNSEVSDLKLHWSDENTATLQIDGAEAWSGALPAAAGAFGLLLEPDSHARVSKFSIEGDLRPATRRYLWTEGILSAAQPATAWEAIKDNPNFTHGVGAISVADGVSAKWNVEGTSLALHAPRGPEFGRAKLFIDGHFATEINYNAVAPERSGIQFAVANLEKDRHTVRLEATEGRIPVDVLEVTGD